MGEGGMPCGLELDCLVRKIGVGHYILKEGNPDIETFPLKNIIAGPVKMMPLKGKRWLCSEYKLLYKHFDVVKKIDREPLFQNFISNNVPNQ